MLNLLYVKSPAQSVKYYQKMLGKNPVEQSENFAMFVLEHGQLGLWASHDVEPKIDAAPGGSELGIAVDDVDATFAEWNAKGATILQQVTDMDFGRTFVVSDPDGHRIRFYKLFE